MQNKALLSMVHYALPLQQSQYPSQQFLLKRLEIYVLSSA